MFVKQERLKIQMIELKNLIYINQTEVNVIAYLNKYKLMDIIWNKNVINILKNKT